MITFVRIENWKAYKSFELRLEPGTTFLVAPNGVGKTSFIDAVQWALNRDAAPTKAVMRRRAKTTSVDVELIAGDATVRIKRSLTVGRGRTPTPSVQAWINDAASEPNEALQLLAEVWNADNQFACRAAFLTDRFLDKDAEPDLRSHLTRLHALDHVQGAITTLGPAIKIATDEAEAARKDARASDADLQQAVDLAAAAASTFEAAAARSERLRAEAASAAHELAEGEQANQAHAENQAWLVGRAAIVSDIAPLLGTVPEDMELRVFLRSAEAGASRQLLELSEQRARLSERLAVVEESLQRLRASEGECPVCRRPLDPQSRGYAEDQHEHDHGLAVQELDAIDVATSATAALALRQLAARADALGDHPTAPASDSIDLEALEARGIAAKGAFEKALEDVGRAQLAVTESNAKVDEIKAEQHAKSSVKLYTKVAALEAAKAALEATVTQVLEAQLGPVSDEVNRRWEAIFPDRPGLRLDPSGRIVRTFDDDEDDLAFDSFSSGEKVVAKLLLRLATLTSTTDVPFCLIDEPLEHLDPDARSYVGRTLAYLSSGGALHQIFVTTYEQDLALQLAGMAGDQVRLEFLRTAHVSQ